MPERQGELFDPTPAPEGGGTIEAAARATIAALRSTGSLDATHTLKVELIMTGARALDREFAWHKVSVAAMQLFSKVVDIADGLPTIQQAINDQFEAIVKALADAD